MAANETNSHFMSKSEDKINNLQQPSSSTNNKTDGSAGGESFESFYEEVHALGRSSAHPTSVC